MNGCAFKELTGALRLRASRPPGQTFIVVAGAVLAALISGCTGSLADQPTTVSTSALAITGATVIDGTGAPPEPGTTILIRHGRIAAMGAAGEVPVPEGAEVIDASGKYVIPGLADMHVHFSSGGMDPRTVATTDRLLRQFLYYGVTTVLNLGATGGGAADVVELRRRWAGDEPPPSPRLFATGDLITLPGSHPVSTIMSPPAGEDAATYDWSQRGVALVASPAEARATVRRHAVAGMDGIKIVVESGPSAFGDDHPQMPPEIIAAIVAEASAHGLPVFAHVSSLDELEAAVSGGVDGLVHAVTDPPLPGAEHWAAMQEKGVYYLPTFSLFAALFSPRWESGKALEGPFLRAGVPAATLDSLTGWRHPAWQTPAPLRAKKWRGALASVKAAHDAGVSLVLGTDTGNPFVFPGHSTHLELELMVEAGLTPMAALVAATRRGAEMMGLEDTWGTLEVGKAADLLILGDDPLADIKNTRSLETVVRGGEVLDRASLLTEN